MKIPKPCCLSPGDFTDVEQFFAITIIFKSMSFSVFTLAWPIETVPQSKLRGPLLCSSGFLLWADHKEAFFAGNDLLNSLVKYPSNIPHSPVWCFCLQLWASLCYCFQLWIHSFIVYSCCLEQSVLSDWVLRSKSDVYVYTSILKLKSIEVLTSVLPKYCNHHNKSFFEFTKSC